MDAARKYEAAANEAACAFLLSAGSGAIGAAAWSLVTGGPIGWGAALAITGMSGLAYGLGCGEGWDTGITPNPNGNECWRVSGYGDLTLAQKDGSGNIGVIKNNVTEILSVEPASSPYNVRVTFKYLDGSTDSLFSSIDWDNQEYRIIPVEGYCNYTGGSDELPPAPDVPPYVWTDPDDGCKITAIFEGLLVDQRGIPGPVFTLKPSGSSGVRTTGGIIRGCNFSPVVYYLPPGGGGGGGGPTWIPDLPGPPLPDGTPWWVDPIIRGLASGATSFVLSEILEQITNPNLPATSREIYAACENKADGTPETFSVNFPSQSLNDRILSALDAMVDFDQQFHLWKSPTCGGTPTPVTGDPVTINWISDEPSPVSGDRFVKRFVYFDQSGSTLLQTVEHWNGFSWTSGPVCVSAKGTALGKPQVWAMSADEAKRVINHAAAIAGADMTNVEWLVSTSKSSRYGLTGTMRVMRDVKGVLGITKRDGPSGYPDGYR
jgi:hypothetical protein